MKALNLKNISWSLIISAMMCMVAFASCSDDEKEDVNITFPELKEETHVVGDEIEISFNAPVDWQLTSKAAWCKFVNGDFEDATTSGKAGDQTVTAKILGDGQDYINDNTTEITLKMGDKEQVIYKITRSKKAFSGLTIKSVPEAEGEEAVEYSAENPIVVKGCDIDADRDGYLLINASLADANLKVGIKEGDNPDWVKVESTDNGFKLSFNRNNSEGFEPKNSIGKDKAGNIKFSVMTSDETIINEVAIPVEYEGLKEGVILVDPVYSNLTVSTDGQTFTEIPSGMETGTPTLKTYEEKLVSTITVRDDKFHVLVGSAIKKDALGATVFNYDFTETPDWVTIAQEEGVNITVTANPLGDATTQRGAIVLVLPENEWNKLKEGDINEALIDVEGWGEYSYHVIKDAYSKGIMATLIQEPEKQVGDQIVLTAFYAQDINDWSQVTEDDLTPIEMIEGSLQTGEEIKTMLQDNGIDVMGEQAWLLSVPNFMKGSSFCIRVDNVLPEHQMGMPFNPWGTDNVRCHEETINGKRYIILTALKDNITIPSEPCSVIIGDQDSGVFPAECYFQFY